MNAEKKIEAMRIIYETKEPPFLTTNEIAKMFTLSTARICQITKEHGFTRSDEYKADLRKRTSARKPKKAWTTLSDEEIDGARKLFEQTTETRINISKRFEISLLQVNKMIECLAWERMEDYQTILRNQQAEIREINGRKQPEDIEKETLPTRNEMWPVSERFDTKERHLYQADISDDEFYKRAVNSKFSDLRVKAPASIYEDQDLSNCRPGVEH